MIEMTIVLVRQAHLSRSDFQTYWREKHGPLVRSLASQMGIAEYIQMHAVDDTSSPGHGGHGRWMPSYDGIAQVRFRSRDDFEAALATSEGLAAARQVGDDERKFIDRNKSARWWSVEYRII